MTLGRHGWDVHSNVETLKRHSLFQKKNVTTLMHEKGGNVPSAGRMVETAKEMLFKHI
jgi:hypothetical protein